MSIMGMQKHCGSKKSIRTKREADEVNTTTESRSHDEVITKNKQPQETKKNNNQNNKPQEKNNNNQNKPQTKTTETKDEVEDIKNKFKDIA
jgi:hypothetical protein